VRGGYVEAQQLDETRQARRLTLREVQHQPRERRSVDDRVLKRALQPAADKPCVERIVAVLDQDSTLRETQERPTGIAKLGRADKHRAVDVVALLRVGVDRRAAIDEGVEERERAG
jgi:hypothetical protein